MFDQKKSTYNSLKKKDEINIITRNIHIITSNNLFVNLRTHNAQIYIGIRNRLILLESKGYSFRNHFGISQS